MICFGGITVRFIRQQHRLLGIHSQIGYAFTGIGAIKLGITAVSGSFQLQVGKYLLHLHIAAGDGHCRALHGDGLHLDDHQLIFPVRVHHHIPCLQSRKLLVGIFDGINSVVRICRGYRIDALNVCNGNGLLRVNRKVCGFIPV